MALKSPTEIVGAAEKIYNERYREEYEKSFHDHFVIIDIRTGLAYHEEWPERALAVAREKAPNGIFHMIRVGSPGAFRVSYTRENASLARPFRSIG